MDLKTLWDRANDAINTIIRRDESTETGEFLQPCIEGNQTIFSQIIIFISPMNICIWVFYLFSKSPKVITRRVVSFLLDEDSSLHFDNFVHNSSL